jgi:serine/threonine protein kinase
LKDTNKEMAIKIYKIIEDRKKISRDIDIGFNKNLDSQYIVNYRDKFIVKSREGNIQCVVMDLLDGSLNKFLLNQKKLLTDEV